jgi:hypothetical protein
VEVVEGNAGFPSLEGYRLRMHLLQLAQEISVFYRKSCTFSTFSTSERSENGPVCRRNIADNRIVAKRHLGDF